MTMASAKGIIDEIRRPDLRSGHADFDVAIRSHDGEVGGAIPCLDRGD